MEIAVDLNLNCRHCGTRFLASRASDEFCCTGCETVFGLIQREGLGGYYDLLQAEPPSCPVPARVSSETYAYFDDSELVNRVSPDGRRMKFYVEGLNCTACLWLLEKLPSICADASFARVNMSDSTVEVEKTESGRFSSIARTLDRLGHKPHPLAAGESSEGLGKDEKRRELIRIGLTGAATGNLMIMAVSLYAGAGAEFSDRFRWISAALAFPVLTYGAWPFYKSALGAVRNFRLNIDVPIVAAIWAGIAMSLWGLATGGETLYFDSLSMLTLLLLSSRFLLAGLQREHLGASKLQDELLLATVERVGASGTIERVSSLALVGGDKIRIGGEMTIPVDGVISSGAGTIETSVLTGESDAIEVASGHRVEAGSRNLSGAWILEASAPASQSRIANVLNEAEASSKSKTKIDALADKVAQWFVALVLLTSIGVVVCFWTTNPAEGLSRALALTIVTCPCVFGMAIPLSMSLAARAAARRGIVIKDGNAIEKLWNAKTLFFDKTGTLTEGSMGVISHDADARALAIAVALERDQVHPVAKAILSLHATRFRSVVATEVETLASGGIRGVVDGIEYRVVPVETVVETESPIARSLNARYSLLTGEDTLATFELGDRIRGDALETLRRVRSLGLETRLISGDRAGVVDRCGFLLGFNSMDVSCRQTPESKSKVLEAAGAGAVMIGDGANDAAALSSADVGIAVRGSMEVSLRAADVYLARPDLRAIPELLVMAKKTKRAILRNLSFSVAFNLVAGFLALTGAMTPLLAAIFMPLSSLTVLLSAVATGNRLVTTKERR